MKDAHIRHDCRLCGGDYETVLDLGETPLANEYMSTREESLKQDRFPLYVVKCKACGHYQLPVVVNPERLFRNYAYQSGTSPVFREHLRLLAEETQPGRGELVVDIASNDGTLLHQYKRHGCKVVGVDPARNLAEKATAEGVLTLPVFFTREVARRIVHDYGHAKLITCLNAFAHADDLHEIAAGMAELLDDDGEAVIEVGSFVDVCAQGLFDTIYHEHLSYHTLEPLREFFAGHGMHVRGAAKVASQGGSMRLHVAKGRDHAIRHFPEFDQEPDVGNLRVKIDTLSRFLRTTFDHGASVFGCPAKLTTLLYACEIDPMSVAEVYDDSPLKAGKYVPGSGRRIWALTDTQTSDVEFPTVIGSWNFADEIIPRLRAKGFKGDMIVPLPELRVYV